MTKPLILADEWASFRRLLPATAGPMQIAETRRAFYAGATALLSGLAPILKTGVEPTMNDLRMIAAVAAELQAFMGELAAQIKREEAG